jgi:hypothetical protein
MAGLVSSAEGVWGDGSVVLGRGEDAGWMLLPGGRADVRAINQVWNGNHRVCSEDLLLSRLHFLTHNSSVEKRKGNFRAIYHVREGPHHTKDLPFLKPTSIRTFHFAKHAVRHLNS